MQNKQKSDPQNPQNLKTSCLSHTGHRLSTNEDLWRKYEEEFIKNEKSGKKCSFIKQKFFQQYMDEFNPQELATNANLESPLILRKKSSGRKSNVNKSMKSSFQDLDKLKFIKSQIFEEEGQVEQECLQEQNEIIREQDKQEKKSMGLVITISFLYLMMLSIQNTVYKMSFNFMRHTFMGNNLTYVVLFFQFVSYALSSVFIPFKAERNYKVILFFASLLSNIFTIFIYFASFCNAEYEDDIILGKFICDSAEITYGIGIVIGIINGICLTFIWIVQEEYLDKLTIQNKSKKEIFNSIFWNSYQLQFIIGNLLAFKLFQLGNIVYFQTMLFLGVLCSFGFLFLVPNKVTSKHYLAKTSYFQSEDEEKTVYQIAQEKSTFQDFKNLIEITQTQYLILYLCIKGIGMACFIGFTGYLVENNYIYQKEHVSNSGELNSQDVLYVNQETAFIYFISGFSYFLTGYFVLKIKNSGELLLMAKIGNYIGICNVILTIFCLYKPSFLLNLNIAILWGIFIIFNSWIGQFLCLNMYPGAIEIWKIYKVTESISAAIFFLLQVFLHKYIYFSLILLVFGLCHLVVNKLNLARPDIRQFLLHCDDRSLTEQLQVYDININSNKQSSIKDNAKLVFKDIEMQNLSNRNSIYQNNQNNINENENEQTQDYVLMNDENQQNGKMQQKNGFSNFSLLTNKRQLIQV